MPGPLNLAPRGSVGSDYPQGPWFVGREPIRLLRSRCCKLQILACCRAVPGLHLELAGSLITLGGAVLRGKSETMIRVTPTLGTFFWSSPRMV